MGEAPGATLTGGPPSPNSSLEPAAAPDALLSRHAIKIKRVATACFKDPDVVATNEERSQVFISKASEWLQHESGPHAPSGAGEKHAKTIKFVSTLGPRGDNRGLTVQRSTDFGREVRPISYETGRGPWFDICSCSAHLLLVTHFICHRSACQAFTDNNYPLVMNCHKPDFDRRLGERIPQVHVTRAVIHQRWSFLGQIRVACVPWFEYNTRMDGLDTIVPVMCAVRASYWVASRFNI